MQALFLGFPAYARGDSEEITAPDDTYYAAIIKIDSEDAIEELEKEGVNILRRRDELLLCFIPFPKPSDIVSEQSASRNERKPEVKFKRKSGVSKIERGRRVTPNMDMARRWFDAYIIHESSNQISPYTGKGVVTGICDIGIDPLHIAFLNEDGNPRIKRIVQYKEGSGERIVLESKEEYELWQTDTPDNWHATHVANIMAGGFGEYRGMAPESDIVISTSQLTDVGLLCGAEDILDYAREEGKRAVINMSMGNYTGPHDGSSLFSQYLDKIAAEGIVVLSAGNAGNSNFTLPVDFSGECSSIRTAIYSSDWVQFNPYGAVDIWSADDSPLKVRFGIWDADLGKEFLVYPWQQLNDGETFSITSDPTSSSSSDEEANYDEAFASIYSGWFELKGGVDAENRRYQALLQYDAHTDIVSAKGRWARYVPFVEIAGSPGTHADIYADWQCTLLRSLPGSPSPSSLLSFSDLACGHNVVSVGMYVNRDHTPTIGGEEISISRLPGSVAPESSYSTLFDGRLMPLTVAPGYNVVSAMNRYFWEAHPDSEPVNGETIKNDERYLWVTNHGTSMSAPYVAGTIACWLEALPYLTSEQVQDIIGRSNRQDFPDGENPRHGQGYIDPVEGLKLALLSFSSTGERLPAFSTDASSADLRRLSFASGILSFWNPETKPSLINIYDSAGNLVASLSSSSPAETWDLSSIASICNGLYIVNIAETGVTLKLISRH